MRILLRLRQPEVGAVVRREDVSQLAREFSRQANGDSRMKAIWWLAATLGQHNQEVYCGELGLSNQDLAALAAVGAI